ncbi:hypothetical protein OOT46_18585 [Aquabacterium sp. A7-Y]|uniref:hypothetical protein n=1 Tax=Aquabacterium sp. A7-Y TaxID=1349605 RepID=UPI00223DE1F9|nr:hypothetical protein [Aquabacterium sp. A7-Y]MCW7539846.1 hypothetical protein [Aquabacterium sp. A7-Y]
MYLIPITWLYVVLMMAIAEATSTQGTLLGAFFTFVLYGLGPAALVTYLLGTPRRRQARRLAHQRAREAAAQDSPALPPDPDGGRHAAGEPVAPERKEP